MSSLFENLPQDIRDQIYAHCLLVQNTTVTNDDHQSEERQPWTCERFTTDYYKNNRQRPEEDSTKVEKKSIYLTWKTPALLKVNRNISADATRYYYRENEFVSVRPDEWLLREFICSFIPLKFVKDMNACANIPTALHLEVERWHLPTINDCYYAIMPATSLPLLVDFVNTWSYRKHEFIADLPDIVPSSSSRSSVRSIHAVSTCHTSYYEGSLGILERLLTHLEDLQRSIHEEKFDYLGYHQHEIKETWKVEVSVDGFNAIATEHFLNSLKATVWSAHKGADEAMRILAEANHLFISGDLLGARGKSIVAAYMCGTNGLTLVFNRRLVILLPNELICILLEIWMAHAKVSVKLGIPKEVERVLGVTRWYSQYTKEHHIEYTNDPNIDKNIPSILVEFISARLRSGDLQIAKRGLRFGMSQYPKMTEFKDLQAQFKSLYHSRCNSRRELEQAKAQGRADFVSRTLYHWKKSSISTWTKFSMKDLG
jgi:hypothetical protein